MLSLRVALLFEPGAHPSPPFIVPAEAMCVLHLQRCLPRAAKLWFAKSSAEPSLAAVAESVGSTGVGTACPGGTEGLRWDTQGDNRDCPFSKAGARFVLGLGVPSRLYCFLGDSVAHLRNG